MFNTVNHYYCCLCGTRHSREYFGNKCGTPFITGTCQGVVFLSMAVSIRRINALGLKLWIFSAHGDKVLVSPVIVKNGTVYPISINPDKKTRGIDVELLNEDRLADVFLPTSIWTPSGKINDLEELLKSDKEHEAKLKKNRSNVPNTS